MLASLTVQERQAKLTQSTSLLILVRKPWVIKGFLGEMLGGPAAGTPLDKAQELMYQAFGTPDPEERVKLAKQAIDLSPDCADAYVLLAKLTKSRKEALDLFEKGVAAGERALGPKAFQEDVGHFWSLLETRPYMRAREGLARKLWTMGRRDEAIKHLQDMLRLNPGDNQGVRYTLAGWLLAEGRDEELADLLKEYDEGSANWAYTKALVAFRQNGDTLETRKLLKVAQKANKHVPAYLYQVRKIRALLFHGLCRLGKIDWASESHQELDRCLSRTITASKNFND